MKRLYEPFAYGQEPIAQSFWRESVTLPEPCPAVSGEVTCDTAIIGAGFTGLNAALKLAEAGEDVVVLDAQQPGWGASGRNGGFCCLGGAKLDPAAIRRRFGEEAARTYARAERQAVDHVRDLLDRHRIEADTHSRGETLLAHRPKAVAELKARGEEVARIHGLDCAFLSKEELPEHGMASPEFHAALTTPIGFALNPMKYVLGLAAVARDAGARLFGDSPVERISAAADGRHLLHTPSGQMRARRFVIATNGYSSEDVPRWMAGRYLPVQSSILASRVLTPEERAAQGWTTAQMCYDSRNLLHYFRLLPDGRMLFGMRGSTRSRVADHERVRTRMRADFERFFPAWRDVETPHFWSGFVCLSRDLTPFVGAIPGSDGGYAAFAYHGNGVAMGSYAGVRLAEMMLGQGDPLPAVMTTPPRRFELGPLRRAVLPLAYAWYGLQDRS
ncbi:MAG: FAD-dependent oxidoreductase [Rhodobacteraceae bacterium]|nr:FAD-dependent oxidoreductase [Paracoccaceae bacterium]